MDGGQGLRRGAISRHLNDGLEILIHHPWAMPQLRIELHHGGVGISRLTMVDPTVGVVLLVKFTGGVVGMLRLAAASGTSAAPRAAYFR